MNEKINMNWQKVISKDDRDSFIQIIKEAYPKAMWNDLAPLDVLNLLSNAYEIQSHTGIRTTANSIIDLINRYKVFFTGFTTVAAYQHNKKDLRTEIEIKVKQLGDELQAYTDKKKSKKQEERRFLLGRRDFWITLCASLLTACIPVIVTWFLTKNDSDKLEKRINELESKVLIPQIKLTK